VSSTAHLLQLLVVVATCHRAPSRRDRGGFLALHLLACVERKRKNKESVGMKMTCSALTQWRWPRSKSGITHVLSCSSVPCYSMLKNSAPSLPSEGGASAPSCSDPFSNRLEWWPRQPPTPPTKTQHWLAGGSLSRSWARAPRTFRHRIWPRSNAPIRLGKSNGWNSTRGSRGRAQWPACKDKRDCAE